MLYTSPSKQKNTSPVQNQYYKTNVHQDGYTADTILKVIVVFNHFGLGLSDRMPKVRIGYAHVANSKYDEWLMYAIGESSDPTILSEGNYFMASNDPYTKQD
ncbi:hypothetical protein HYC85_017463 [Camellia sinensis]|uniref:Pectate lyase n=1 Tax=Camellia sinensis TaxID=4442 RepID=A0A7J7GV55_CAMSI|nr:hypothetical protein HYC85_017463 [Camellia sinensis]